MGGAGLDRNCDGRLNERELTVNSPASCVSSRFHDTSPEGPKFEGQNVIESTRVYYASKQTPRGVIASRRGALFHI
jgi:hypothetical protein